MAHVLLAWCEMFLLQERPRMNYNVTTIRFEWDERKARANIDKHGITFEEAESVFDDPEQLSILDRRIDHEERWITMGLSITAKLIVVAHTYGILESGNEQIRIISARQATKKEGRDYEKRI